FVSLWFRCPPRSTRILHAAQAARPAPRAARSRRPRSGFCGYSSFLGPRIGITPERRSREIEHSGVKEQAGLLRADEISCHGRHPIKLTVGPALWRRFCPRQSPFRSSHGGIRPWGPPIPRLKRHKRPDHRHHRLLRACRERPRRRRAAEQRDELAPLHSITSSARARIPGGNISSIALAVLRLTASSNLTGCSTGRSAGFLPCKILCT